jgi:hypothetical protein
MATRRILFQRKCLTSARHYSYTPLTASWWNPFSRGGARDANAQATSSRTTGTEADNPRRLQERKDATLALLATEFRRLSLEHPNLQRDQVVDQAFDSLEQKDLDSKTLLQLRHELQTSLDTQVVELFQAFGRADETLPDLEDQDDPILDNLLQLELERTIDGLADPTPLQAPKGPHPIEFLTLKRRALETLLERRKEVASASTNDDGDGDGDGNDENAESKPVSWVDADEFGYHETIDAERNAQIRHYQAINLCRSAKVRDDWGFSVVAMQSSIAGAGRGVYVDGYAKAGSILCFQPGQVWSKEHLVNLPVEVERELEKNDHYQMSLRPDDFMIDSRKAPYTVLTGKNSNPMALGHVINHATPSKPPNCRTVMVNITQGMKLGELKRYIPNTYARPRSLTQMGGLWDHEAIDMHGMCLIATRDICNEEIFYDYRLMTPHLPSWYHRVEDTAYETSQEEEGEAKS